MRPRDVTASLGALGVTRGGVLLVHTAFSQVREVEGGPAGLIEALLDAVGPEGTLVMPSMADTDDEPFDPAETPCLAMGIVAETFRTWPGVLRSDSPHAFAARGPHAARITAAHPLEIPHGPDSPVGRVHELDGQVLLLGVGHDANTTIHLAENLAGVRYRLPCYSTVFRGGARVRVEYGEVDHCCQRFARLDEWFAADGGTQRRGEIGRATVRLAESREIVRSAWARLAADETVFLHPRGECAECDAAWASLPSL